MDAQEYSGMTFRDYLKIIFRQKAVIILSFVTVVTVVFLQLTLKTPTYQAHVKMLISADKLVESPYYQELNGGGHNTQATLTQSEIVKSSPVLDRSVQALHLDRKPVDYEKEFASPLRARQIDLKATRFKANLDRMTPQQQSTLLYRKAVADLRSQVEVVPIRDTNMFNITVTEFDPLGAAIIANVISRSYVMFDLQQQLTELELKYGAKHPTVMQIKDSLVEMAETLDGQPLSDAAAIGPASVKIIEQATIPTQPIGVGKPVTLLIAAVMSIFLGLVLAFIFEYLDQTVKSPRDLEEKLSLSFLGGIPRLKFQKSILLSNMKNLSVQNPYARSFANLADQLRLIIANKKAKTILLAEVEREDDLSAVIANLGFTFSQHMDRRILIIDANFRKQYKGKEKNINLTPGFFDIVVGKATLQESVKEVSSHLWVLPSGSTLLNPITFLESDKAKELIAQARAKFDIVLIEGPDLKAFKDSLLLSSFVDGVVLVVAESKTRIPVVNWILKPLKEHNAVVLGAILNRRKLVLPKFIYERV